MTVSLGSKADVQVPQADGAARGRSSRSSATASTAWIAVSTCARSAAPSNGRRFTHEPAPSSSPGGLCSTPMTQTTRKASSTS